MPAITTFRSIVAPSDCDVLGHMNVARYFTACGNGGFALQSEMGLTARDMAAGRRLSFAVVHAESDFRAELIAGDAMWLESGVLEIGTKSMTFLHRLYRAEDQVLSFESRFKTALMSLEQRRAVVIPDDLRAAAERFRFET